VKVEFPKLEVIEANNKFVDFTLPAWNVVKLSAFRYFIPEDEIDRGLMLLRAKKKEEVKDDGK